MKFIESFYDNYTFLYIMGGICCIGVLMKCCLLYGYVRLIRASESMATTNTNWMKNMKQKFETSYQLKIGVNNVDIFVDKHVNRSKFCGVLLSTWEDLSGQTITLCLAVGIFAGISGLVYDCGAGRVLFTFFVGAWTAIIVNIVDNVVNIPAHKQLLRLNLKDYFENYLKTRMEQEHLNSELRKQTRRELLYDITNSAMSQTAATLQDTEISNKIESGRKETEETLSVTPVKVVIPKPVVVKPALSKNTVSKPEKEMSKKDQKKQLQLLKTMELEREKELKEEKKRLESLSKESSKEKKKQEQKAEKQEKKNEKLVKKDSFKEAKRQKKEELKQAKLQAIEQEKQAKLAKKEEKKQNKLTIKQAKQDAIVAKKDQKEQAIALAKQQKEEKQQERHKLKEAKKQEKIDQKQAAKDFIVARKQEKIDKKEADRLAKVKAKEDAKISKYVQKQEKMKEKQTKLQEKIARASNPVSKPARKEEKTSKKVSQKAYHEKMRLKEEKQRTLILLEEERKKKGLAQENMSFQEPDPYEGSEDIIEALVKQKKEQQTEQNLLMEQAEQIKKEANECIATSKEEDALIEEVLREFFM